VPFTAVLDEPAVEPERFLGADHPFYPGGWSSPPHGWPEAKLEAREVRDVIDGVIAELPSQQRQVITLRDVVGCDAEETCNALGLTEVHQRVLLHRARSRVRRAVERYMES
jgi:RNA polymerase sigma-70 factor (ECF subfamily)